MQQYSRDLYNNSLVIFAQYKTFIEQMNAVLQASLSGEDGSLPMEEVCDSLVVMRNVAGLANTLKNDIERLEELHEQVVCLMYLRSIKHVNSGDPITTPYCTVTPRTTYMCRLPNPKRDMNEYQMFLRFFNFREDVIEKGMVQPHWPTMIKYVEECDAEGLPLPPGCTSGRTMPVYSCTVYTKGKKGIND